MRTIAEVVEDIKNGTWGSDIEYQSECEKLHKLCDEILEIEKAKTERVVAELCKEANDTTVDFCNGVFVNVESAIDIVKAGGVE
jgi:uncharacterized tellurite resistance protein B-like protein